MTGETGKVEARVVTITPKIANQLLLRNTHNRPVRTAAIEQYAADMRKGDWQVNGEAIKISVDGHVLDGQHRLYAVLEADASMTTLLITGLPQKAQETMDQGRARTFGDVLKLRGEHDYFNLAAAVRIVCIYEQHGIPIQPRGTVAPSVQQLSRTLERNPEIRESVKLGSSLRRSWLSASVIAGLHFLFSIADHADAEDFIKRVCTGENLAVDDPRYVLRERLIREDREATGLHVKVKTAFVVRAWNAYRSGEAITRLMWNPGGSNPDRFPAIDGLSAARAAA